MNVPERVKKCVKDASEMRGTPLGENTFCRKNKSIYLHRGGPLENGLDRPENYYGRYGFASFSSVSVSTVGMDGARVSLGRVSFLALWVVVVDISQFLVLDDGVPDTLGALS